jgi:hypothetical protein
MIRPLTALAALVFVGSGFHVFQAKEEVIALDRELRAVHRKTEEERQRTRLLNAEWARLNDQERLRNLANAHLREMQPMEPQQFVRLEDAPRRMPGPVAFAAPPDGGFRARADAPSAPGEVLVFTAASLQALARAAEEPRAPLAVPAAPAMTAAAPTPVPVPAPAQAPAPMPAGRAVASAAVANAAAPEAPRPAARTVAPAAPVTALAAATPPPASPRPRGEAASLPPIAGPAAPVAPPPQRVAAAPQPAVRPALHVQPAAPPPPMGGSVLGAGMALPPPVPFGR